MSSPKTLLLTLLGTVTMIGGAIALRQQSQTVRPAPKNPAAVELLQAHAFQLDEGFLFDWRSERPLVTSGYLLVFKADPELLRRRQTFESVLYVGDQTAERLNNSGPGGHLVALVPAGLDSDGNVDLDPRNTPMWLGTPELPERVDAARIAEESLLAISLGLGLPDISRLAPRTLGGQDTIHAADRDELDYFIADLVELYSPAETELIEMLRMPRSN